MSLVQMAIWAGGSVAYGTGALVVGLRVYRNILDNEAATELRERRAKGTVDTDSRPLVTGYDRSEAVITPVWLGLFWPVWLFVLMPFLYITGRYGSDYVPRAQRELDAERRTRDAMVVVYGEVADSE